MGSMWQTDPRRTPDWLWRVVLGWIAMLSFTVAGLWLVLDRSGALVAPKPTQSATQSTEHK